MADPVVAAPAAPVQAAPQSNLSSLGSVERLKSTPEPAKPLASLDDAFAAHFKNKIKATPEEAEEAYKNKGKDEPKEKVESKEESKPQAKEEKVEDRKTSKAVDPETLIPGKEVKSKEAQSNWKQLTENSKKLFNENEKLITRNKELEAVVAAKESKWQKEIEALKAENKELKPYRSMYDLEGDPDFRKSYAEPIKEKKGELVALLKSLTLTDEQIGTYGEFTNENQINNAIRVLRENGYETKADDFKLLFKELQLLEKGRGKSLGDAKNKYEEYSKDREEKSRIKRVEEEAVFNQAIESTYQEAPEFNMMEMPPNATKEQIDEVESHNRLAENLRNHVQDLASQANDPKARALTSAQAVLGKLRDYQLQVAIKKISEMEGELKKISSSSSEKRNVAPSKSTNGSVGAANVEASMDQFFANRRR